MKFRHHFFKNNTEHKITKLLEKANVLINSEEKDTKARIELCKKFDAKIAKLTTHMNVIDRLIENFTMSNAAHIKAHRQWVTELTGRTSHIIRNYSTLSRHDLIELSKGKSKENNDIVHECEIDYKEAVEKQAKQLNLMVDPGFAVNNYMQFRKTGIKPYIAFQCEAVVNNPSADVVRTANALLKASQPYSNQLKSIKNQIQMHIDRLAATKKILDPSSNNEVNTYRFS